jgi:hypothetical protein
MKPLPLLLPLVLAAALPSPALQDFSHYEVILQKQIFGKPPPEPVATPVAATPPGPSWITDYRLAMLVDEGGGQVRAGLVHLRDNSTVSLGLNETHKDTGIQLLSADIAQSSAVFIKGADKQPITMAAAGAIPVAAAPAANPSRLPQAGPGRRFGGSGRSMPPPPAPAQPVEPKLTGAALEAHLQEYQKEVLRKGMPPLPVALTPENDAQLVQEGVLPPISVDADGNVVTPAPAAPGIPSPQ